MKFDICCFTGHRYIPTHALPELTEILDRRIAALCDIGFHEFRTGGALGFDMLAATRVLAARRTHSCRLHLILPCRDQAVRWSARDRRMYEDILASADCVTYLQDTYTPGCMHARNRALVVGSDLCLAFLTSQGGGTAYTCSFAEKQGVRVINLANEMQRL